MERIEVTDLFESYYKVMELIWEKPDFRTQGPQRIPSFAIFWYDLEGFLHENLFIAACARRVYKSIGMELSSQYIQKLIEVCDSTGRRRPGNSGIYYGSGFDWGEPTDQTLKPLVIAADMVGTNLEDTRLYINIK